MKKSCLVLLTLWLLGRADVTLAQSREDTVACVHASTEGQTDRDEGRLLLARAALLACARDVCPSIVRQRCSEWLADLDTRIPSVVVRVHEAGASDILDASVRLDGVPIELNGRPVMLDPGTHTIAVDARGWLPVVRTFLLAEHEQARLLSVQLTQRDERPSPATLPSAKRARVSLVDASTMVRSEDVRFVVPIPAWVLAGVGVAGMIGFAVLETQAKHRLHDLVRSCSPNCSFAQRDSGQHKLLAAHISLGVGAAALAAAGAWTLGSWWRQRKQPATTATLSLLPTAGGGFASWSDSF